MSKVVLYPIKVPVGKYCWDFSTHESCEHFDNEGGHSKCMLEFWEVKDTKNGVIKAEKCASFKDADKEN